MEGFVYCSPHVIILAELINDISAYFHGYLKRLYIKLETAIIMADLIYGINRKNENTKRLPGRKDSYY